MGVSKLPPCFRVPDDYTKRLRRATVPERLFAKVFGWPALGFYPNWIKFPFWDF
jgi:hypothetical protein